MIENILSAVPSEEIEALTCNLIGIEGHEDSEDREKPVAIFIRDYLDAQGVRAELVPVLDGRSNVMARVAGSGDGPVLLLNGVNVLAIEVHRAALADTGQPAPSF